MIEYCGIKYSQETWNEMQRDAYDPDDYIKTYYCFKCQHKHRISSKIGFSHNPIIQEHVKSMIFVSKIPKEE